MNRHELMLAALAAAGENATFSPVQVQKLFFLIDREAAALVEGPHFNFRPYDYGPFDSAVYNALSVLEVNGQAISSPFGRYRVYSLTAEGFQSGNEQLGRLADQTRIYLQQVAAWVRSLSFEQLVAAIYRKYPDMQVNSVFKG